MLEFIAFGSGSPGAGVGRGGVGVKWVPGKIGPERALALDPFQNVPHRHRLPLRAARRRDPPPVQGGGDLPKRLRSCGLRLADRRHDCGGVRISVGLEAAVGDRAGVRQRGVAKGLPTGLRGGERGLRALRNHRALLLSERGIQMQQEGLDLRAEVGDQKRRLMRHEAANEMHVARQSIELGDGGRRSFAVTAGLGQRGGELWASAERVGAPARLGKLAKCDMAGEKQSLPVQLPQRARCPTATRPAHFSVRDRR
jgi:hypothetical protein